MQEQAQLGGKDDPLTIVKLYPTNKWYMHKSESFQENETLKVLSDFEIKVNYPIWARRPGREKENKRTCHIVEFAV